MPDIAHYAGREQEFIKHAVLKEYLPELGYRVGRHCEALAYVDGFSGPWLSKDDTFQDASFGVAATALENVQKGLREKWNTNITCYCFFVEKEAAPFPA